MSGLEYLRAEHDVLVGLGRMHLNNLPMRPSLLRAALYLAALVHEHRREGQWGYTFAATDQGTPTSAFVDEAVENLVLAGRIARQDDGSIRVAADLEHLSGELRVLLARASVGDVITAVMDVLMMVPVGLFREALGAEPVLRSGLSGGSGRLLTPSSPSQSQLAVLDSVGSPQDALVIYVVKLLERLSLRAQSEID
jgi:hypothetical protein